MAWQPNGSGKPNGSGGDPKRTTNITSLDEVRKRAEASVKQKARAARVPSHWRDDVFAGVIVLMAVGMIIYWAAPLFGGPGTGR